MTKLTSQNRARKNYASERYGFTLIELLIVITIIAILAAILFPVFARAREKARQAECASNLAQIAKAAIMYRSDYDEVNLWYHADYTVSPILPKPPQYEDVLLPYIRNKDIFTCPTRRHPKWFQNGYSYNITLSGVPDAWVREPSRLIFFCDSDVDDTTDPSDDYIGWSEGFLSFFANLMAIHNGGANIAH